MKKLSKLSFVEFKLIFLVAQQLYISISFFLCVFVKVRTKLNKTKLTETNFTKPDKLSKPHQIWLNQTKPDQTKLYFFSFVFVKIESELTNRKPTWSNFTKPNQINQTNEIRPNQTKLYFFLLCLWKSNLNWPTENRLDQTLPN